MKRKNLSTILFVVVTIFLLGTVATRCSPPPKPQEQPPTTIRIAMPTWIGYSPLLLAEEYGIDKANGIDLKLERIDNVEAIVSALAAGKLDGVCTTVDAAVKARASGVPIKIVLGFDTSRGGDGLIVAQGINEVADLKGKKVALQVGSPSHFFFLNVITREGLNPEDVSVIPIEPGDAGAAFVAGSVDAAVTWEPWLTKAQEREGGKVLVSSADFPDLIVDILAISDSFLDKNPDAVGSLCKVWFTALNRLNQEKSKSLEIISKGLGVSVGDVEAMMGGIYFYDEKLNRDFFWGGDSQENTVSNLVVKADQFWRTLKLTEEKVSPTEVVSDKPLSMIIQHE